MKNTVLFVSLAMLAAFVAGCSCGGSSADEEPNDEFRQEPPPDAEGNRPSAPGVERDVPVEESR
ncbi:MAG: hypothetical protein KIT74_00115 [Fimbriimonadales bacterium]|nr:hypothetical protein [Fimbriimonadales bacterium]